MGGGGKGGKGGGGGSSAAADTQARLAEQLFSQTDPLRTSLINRSSGFLGAPGAAPAAPGGSFGGKDGMVQGMLAQQGQAPAQGGQGFGDVMSTPTYLAYKDSADRNFNRAKDNVIARVPGGGALTEALVGLEGNRASNLTQGAGAIYGDELNRAMALGTGITGQSMSSLGQAGAIQAQMAAAAAQESAGKSGALGTGIGTAVGLKA